MKLLIYFFKNEITLCRGHGETSASVDDMSLQTLSKDVRKINIQLNSWLPNDNIFLSLLYFVLQKFKPIILYTHLYLTFTMVDVQRVAAQLEIIYLFSFDLDDFLRCVADQLVDSGGHKVNFISIISMTYHILLQKNTNRKVYWECTWKKWKNAAKFH